MHDPWTVAFEIEYPWHAHKPWPKNHIKWESLTPAQQRNRSPHWREGYRESFLTIWHVDPETDGSDDSCGFSYPKLTAKQRDKIKWLAWAEAQEPWLQRAHCKKISDAVLAETLARAGVLATARALNVDVSLDEATRIAVRLVNHGTDNIRGSLCFMPGYHSNSQDDNAHDREYCATGLFSCFARQILSSRRRWYQYPRWHFWHWKFQVHPYQKFKRWLFPEKNQSEASVYQHPEA